MIHKTNAETITQAAQLIQDSQVVAFPTETVYGLWANATNANAVSKIFEIKGRPQDNPLIVHVGHKNDIKKYAHINFELEKTLIDKLMPGPLTIVFPKKNNIPDAVTARLDTIAIRLPDHVSALQLIRKSGCPLAAPSANTSGKPSPTSASMVDHDLGGKLPMIIDGGSCIVGIESTVIKVIDEKNIKILRPWFITKEDLVDATGASVSYATKDLEQSPGTRYRHYAPHGKVRIVDTIDRAMIQDLLDAWEDVGLIGTKEFLSQHKTVINFFTEKTEPNANEPATLQPVTTFPRGSHMKLLECAQSLYNLYHQCDKLNMTVILVENLPEKWVGYAIMNRVKKSMEA